MECSFFCDGTRTPTSCILKAFKKKKIHASVELLSEDTNTSLIVHLLAAYDMYDLQQKSHASVEFLNTNTTNLVHIINPALNDCL